MSDPPIQLWFESSAVDGGSEHRVILEDAPPVLGAARQSVFWRAPEVAKLDLPPTVDSYVCGLALIAAKADRDLVVHAPMSRIGLFNLSQLLAIRHALAPYKFRRNCRVQPQRIVDACRPAKDNRAVAAMSGGLDSTFTVIRHALKLGGPASHNLSALVMVHGFDAAVERPEDFALMRQRAAPITCRAGLPLYTVVTDIKKLDNAAWPESAIPLTANALAMFSADHGFGVVSAGAPYNVLRMGLSHPPVFDSMASNGHFTVITDGGAFGRADKIEALKPFPELLDRLKVCWEGSDPARNCGRCKKCVLTRLNLLTAGVDNCRCFEQPLDLSMIHQLRWRSTYEARDFFTLCWNEMERRGRTGPEAAALRKILSRVPPARPEIALWTRRQLRRLGKAMRF